MEPLNFYEHLFPSICLLWWICAAVVASTGWD